MVEHQAGIPLLMTPLSGHSRDAHDCAEVVCTQVNQLQTTYGTTSLVADRALYSAANLQKLAQTRLRWMTRVPATWSEAQAALAQVNPHALASLTEGYRDHELRSAYGEIEQRWVLISSEARQPPAQHTVDRPWRQQRDQEVKAFKKLCGTTGACEADARQALSLFEQALQATWLGTSTVRALLRDDKPGRPGQGAQPDHVVYQSDGALASSLTSRQALINQHRCFILATNELDAQPWSPQELLDGDKGQSHAERGFRSLKDPQWLASSRSLKTPERLMALLRVMTVCLLV